MTITEALAEIKTIGKRIADKQEFINTYMCRHEGIKDPLEKDGGSVKAIIEAQQSIWDLEQRIVELRLGIAKANETNTIRLEDEEHSIAHWLVWRREVAPNRQRNLERQMRTINDTRRQAHSKGMSVYGAGVTHVEAKPTDVLVNIHESQLQKEIEAMSNILGQLDGQLSLKNATVMVA